MTDPCVPKNGICLQHGCSPLVLDGQCQTGFDAGWTDMMTDDQHRDARDRGITGALRELRSAVELQCRAIREPKDADLFALATIEAAIRLLRELPIKERHKPRRARRKR